MDNKHKKGAFIITLVLFLIFLPLTVIGIMYHKQNKDDNPNKVFYLNNKLYFYSKGNLLGTYECQFKNCGYAKESNLDSDYKIDSYVSLLTPKIINNKYAFISDYKDNQSMIYLFDIKNNDSSIMYESYNDYGIGINDNYYIIKGLNGLYGVIKVTDKVETVIPFNYEYIALYNKVDLETNKLDNSKFIVKKDNKWKLIDASEGEYTALFDDVITAYDDTTVITKKDDFYNLSLYNGTPKVIGSFINYKKLNYIGNYLEVIDITNNYYIYNLNTMSKVSQSYIVNENTQITTEEKDNSIIIVIDGEEKETIEI